jgi:arylformamidase
MKQCRLQYGLVLLVILVLSACAPLGAPQPAALLAAAQPAALSSTPVLIPTAPAAAPTHAPKPTHPAPAPDTSPQHTPIHTAFNLAYAQTAGVEADLQMLDVYYSDPISTRRPVMIYVHGGGWTSGDKTHVDAKPRFFVDAGYVFVSVNYRLSPQAKFPAHVEDVAAAVAWVIKHIETYGGDGSRIFVSGHSAGGHLAVLVSSDERYLKAQGLGLSAIKGVVSIDTAGYDFSIFASRCKNHVLPEPYSIPFGQDPAFWQLASPVSYIQAGKHIPPMAIVYSGDVGIGSDVRRELMATEFAVRLSAASIPNILIGAPDKNHGQINNDFGQSGDEMGQKAIEFLNKIQ